MKAKTRKNGQNMFGAHCTEKTVHLKKETAFEDCVKIIDEVMAGHDIEYTLFYDNFTPEEIEALHKKIVVVMELRSKMMNKPFYNFDTVT